MIRRIGRVVKGLFLIYAFVGSSHVYAHAARDGDSGLKVGKCYPAFPSGYMIRKKINKNQYELAGNWMSPNAILKTKKLTVEQMSLLRKMGPLNMDLKFMGTKDMEMESGFKAPVDLWEECPAQVPVQSDKVDTFEARRSEIKSKSADCQDICFKKDKEKSFKGDETLDSCLIDACK